MSQLYLMRHAKARPGDDQVEGELFSTGDEPLAEVGRRQARAMGRLVAEAPGDVDEVHASTAIRCRETAEIVAEALPGEREVTTHEALLEVPYVEPGAGYRETLAEIVRVAKRLREDPDPELAGGGTWQQATGRFADRLERIVEGPGDPLVVAHGAQNRAWLTGVLGMPDHRLFFLEQDHACLNALALGNGHPVLEKLNVTADPLATEAASRARG